jgi:hypothetical protein
MPFIAKQDRTERVELKVRIRPEVLELLQKYAQYLESEEWYVVQEVLRKGIHSDKQFEASQRASDGGRPKPRSKVKQVSEDI